jgi:acyl-CoA hydrolase
MKLDASLRRAWRHEDARWVFELPQGWGQGRSVFGGVPAALCAALGSREVSDDRPLRTMSLQLLRPSQAGSIYGKTELLREGKSTSFVRVTLEQEQGPTVVANLVYSRPRPEAMRVEARPRPEGPPPEALATLPYTPGLLPEFLQHVELRWASGGVPYSGATEPEFSGYFRFRVPAGGVEGVLALLDVWPCPSLSLLERPAPASTVTWTAHVLAVPTNFEGWFAFDYETVFGAHGMHTVVGRLYSPEGALIGFTEQTVAIFA